MRAFPKYGASLKRLPLLIYERNRPRESLDQRARVASAAPAASLCAGHGQQLGGESPPPNLMEVKG
jgi:hypothetical protein